MGIIITMVVVFIAITWLMVRLINATEINVTKNPSYYFSDGTMCSSSKLYFNEDATVIRYVDSIERVNSGKDVDYSGRYSRSQLLALLWHKMERFYGGKSSVRLQVDGTRYKSNNDVCDMIESSIGKRMEGTDHSEFNEYVLHYRNNLVK